MSLNSHYFKKFKKKIPNTFAMQKSVCAGFIVNINGFKENEIVKNSLFKN